MVEMSSPHATVALWMPWYIEEHRAVSSTMTHLEHSAFCYLQMLFWTNDGKIPNDDKFIARHLHLTARQWSTMRDILLHNCTIAKGFIQHPKWLAELEKAKANVEQKRRAGRASAEARRAQQNGNGRSTAVATDVQPRAGSGSGSLPEGEFSGEGSVTREGEAPFRVVGGGQ